MITLSTLNFDKDPIHPSSLLHKLFHNWVIDLAISFLNYAVLVQVYEPMWGKLMVHQAGMLTRIVYIFIIAYFMLKSLKEPSRRDLVILGLMWMGLWLIFEWGGSILMGRPVAEILIDWNIFNEYM